MDLATQELQVRWSWHDQVLVVEQLASGSLRNGPGTRCDVLPEVCAPFELAHRGTDAWHVHVPPGAAASLDDGVTVQSLGSRRLGGELALAPHERALLDFGVLHAELSLAPPAPKARAPLTDRIELGFLYLLVSTALAFGMLLITGSLASGDATDDDLAVTRNIVAEHRVLLHPPPPPQLSPKQEAVPTVAKAPPKAAPHPAIAEGGKPARGKDGKGRPDAAQQVRSLFGSGEIAKMLAPGDLGAGLAAAVAGIGPGGTKVAVGFEGLALRGGPPGGPGPGNSIGIGALRPGHGTDYGPTHGLCEGLECKESTGPKIDPGPTRVEGSLDKDLIRQVIHRNRAQIRYCYEQSLVAAPELAGKVEVHIVIGGEGNVLNSQVASSTTHTPALDSCVASRFKGWLFPKPKGGGIVEVSYPVVLQRAGAL